MDITRLRTLTLKSNAFFYSDPKWTIEKLINDKPSYVIKAYYEQEKISFNQEVLDILKAKYPEFIEIEKPSKLMSWKSIIYSKINNNYAELSYQELKKIIVWHKIRKIPVNNLLIQVWANKKQEHMRKNDNINLVINKKSLQEKNHGK